MGPSTVHVVIPCYNPPPGWVAKLVQRMAALRIAAAPVHLRFVLVNDGSVRGMDATQRELVLDGLGDAVWLDHTVNRGKGAALRTGVRCTGPALVLFTDVDVPYTVPSMAAAIDSLVRGSDIVLGHRANTYYERVPATRVAISRLFRFVLKRVLGFAITDTQCGLKAFNAAGRELFLATTVDRFLFDMEFVMIASRKEGIRIATVDAELDEGVTFTRMNSGILLREGINFLGLLARSARRD